MCSHWRGDLTHSTPADWLARTATAAVALRALPQSIVVDCGCGRCELRCEPWMKTREYIGLDATPVVPKVIQRDFCVSSLPRDLPGRSSDRVIVALGLLEYLDCAPGFVVDAADVADAMLFTYAPADCNAEDAALGRVNWFSVREILAMASLGWGDVAEVARGTVDDPRTMFVVCRSPRRPAVEVGAAT